MEIYLFITLISVGLLGVRLYQLGSVWSEEFMEDKELSKRINNILLVLFYLFNAGLVMVSVIIWDNDSPQAIYGLSRVGLAFTAIGTLHLFNMTAFLVIFHFGETRKQTEKWKI